VPLLALGLVLLLPLLAIVLMPLTLVQRYRMGSARRRARGWLAALNVFGIAASTALFLAGAAVASYWVAGSFSHALLGVAGGSLLGVLGLVLSRWEAAPGSLHYTPNRWLVLTITLVAAGRIAWGLANAWHSWRTGAGDGSWLASAGVAESLAAGAVVLGYYLAYWMGVRRRFRRHLGQGA